MGNRMPFFSIRKKIELNLQSKIKKTTLYWFISTAVISILFQQSYANNLVMSSDLPSLKFNDTRLTGDEEWDLIGLAESDGSGLFTLFDNIGSNEHSVFSVKGSNGSSNNKSSLIVDSSGDVSFANYSVVVKKSPSAMGIGTNEPLGSLHIKDPDFPELVLEHTGGSGDSIRWQIKSQGDHLGINNNGSDNIFRVYDGAESEALSIGSSSGGSSNVGIGTDQPEAKLDVRGDINATFKGSGGSLQTLFKMSANNSNPNNRSDVGFVLENTRENFAWAFRTLEDVDNINGTTGFAISKQNTGGREFILINNTSNDAEKVELHLGSGASNVNGQWENASSRSYKKNIHELSGEDAMQAMRGLKSVTYQFKRDEGNEKMIGFIAEEVPELLATKTRKTVDPLRIIAVLTKAVQEQDKSLISKDRKISDMESRLNHLEKLIKQKN